MSVVIETSIGDLVIDLYVDERPTSCKNFLKLCKMKYYHYSSFYNIQKNYVAQTGDPTGTGRGGESVYGLAYGDQAKYFEMERFPKIKHRKLGQVSMINNNSDMHGSQFLITLSPELDHLDGKHTVFGEVAKGLDVLETLNEWICDREGYPYQDIKIIHTVILDDPFDDLKMLSVECGRASPEPTDEKLKSDRIRVDEDINQLEGLSADEIDKYMNEREANTRAKLLEIIGDLPDADVKPPENVLFICKLNPVTTDDDLELIFSRFGKINSCEVIRDAKTGDSLCYAFIDFDKEEECENAYFKMDNVLIDDRRIHVDFSQSVSKVPTWKGKGTGTGYFDDNRNYLSQGRNHNNSKSSRNAPKKNKRDTSYDLLFDEDESAVKRKYEPVKSNREFEKRGSGQARDIDRDRDRDKDKDKDRYRDHHSAAKNDHRNKRSEDSKRMKAYRRDDDRETDWKASSSARDKRKHSPRGSESPDRDRDRNRNKDISRDLGRDRRHHHSSKKHSSSSSTSRHFRS